METTYIAPHSEHMGEPEVYGYRVKDLIIFAQLCNDANITPEDLKGFTRDTGKIFGLIAMRMRKAIDDVSKEFRPEDMWRFG